MFSSIDSRISVFHIQNSGVSHARNYGISKASGELLCFVDSDDTIVSYALSMIVQSVGDFDLLMYGIRIIPSGIENHLQATVDYTSIDNLASDFKQIDRTHLLNSPCNKCYRLNTILNYGICFPEDISMGEDLIFNMEYIKRCNTIRVLGDVLYEYDVSVGGSLTKRVQPETVAIQRRLKECVDSTLKYNQAVVETTGTTFVNHIVNDMIRVGSDNTLKRGRKIQLITSWVNDPYFNEQFTYYKNNLKHSDFILLLIKKKQVICMVDIYSVRNFLARCYHYYQRRRHHSMKIEQKRRS